VIIDTQTATASEISLTHTQNQDTTGMLNLRLRNRGPSGIWVISDGMGGHVSGTQASRLIVQGFLDHFLLSYFDLVRFSEDWTQYLRELVAELDTAVYNFGFSGEAFHNDPHRSLMGATITGAVLVDNCLYLVHIGDSRCYLLRNDSLSQLTVDHITADGEYLTQALGSGDPLHPFTTMLRIQAQDRLILLSDGVYKALEIKQIMAILGKENRLENAVRCLVQTASTATQFGDDASVLLVAFG
jgi:serine/threonine protein phosphatase PrpC